MYLKIIILILIILIIFLVFISSNIKENFTNKNYRVALCISGALRKKRGTEIFCNSIIEKIVKPYNPDIFICVYDGNNPIESKYLYDTLKPVTMMVNNKKPQKIENKDFLENSVSMFEKIYLCNELKKEHENKYNFKYDVVIRIRPDLIINSDFKIDFNNLNKNNLFIPKWRFSNYTRKDSITDQLFYGSSYTIDKLINIYIDLKNMSDKCIWPEVVLRKYIYNLQLNVIYFYLEYLIIDYSGIYELRINKNTFNNAKKMLGKYKDYRIGCLNYL